MVEYSRKSMPLALVFPVLRSLSREQMKNRIVSCRNRAAKVDLLRLVWQIELREENGVRYQIVMVRHRSAENLFFEPRLFGLAPKVEVWKQIPSANGVELLLNRVHNAPAGSGKNRRTSRFIRESNPKEDRRISAPVVVDGIAQFHNSWRKRRQGIEMFDQFCRLRDSSW